MYTLVREAVFPIIATIGTRGARCVTSATIRLQDPTDPTTAITMNTAMSMGPQMIFQGIEGGKGAEVGAGAGLAITMTTMIEREGQMFESLGRFIWIGMEIGTNDIRFLRHLLFPQLLVLILTLVPCLRFPIVESDGRLLV